jgi:hypothetical protein
MIEDSVPDVGHDVIARKHVRVVKFLVVRCASFVFVVGRWDGHNTNFTRKYPGRLH